MDEYKNVGAHAEDVEDGRVVGVGQLISLSAEQLKSAHNRRLIDEGILVSTSNKPKGGEK